MAQKMIEIRGERYHCQFCNKICKSEAGLMCHTNRIHPLDTPSGLTCYTCNKNFSQRDLIENHFKTVRHQLECKKMRERDVVEMTLLKEEENEYRHKLLKMNNFKARPYTSRIWQSNETLNIPLESMEKIKDPRINTRKHLLATQIEEEPSKKTHKACFEEDPLQTRSIPKTGESPCATGSVEKTLGEDSTRKIETTTAVKSHFEQEDRHLEKIIIEEDHVNLPENSLIDKCLKKDLNLPQMDTPTEFQSNPTGSTKTEKIGITFDFKEATPSNGEEITLHVSASDLQLFPAEEECQISKNQEDCNEKRTVTLANRWIVTDTVGQPAFEGLIEEDPNIDWLTFISNNINY